MALRASAALGHPPATPLDAARYLAEKGVFTQEEAAFFKKVVGFRNVIVHQYLAVDVDLVKRVLESREYRKVLSLAEKIYKAVQDP